MQYLPVFIISWKRKKIYYYIPFPRINKKDFTMHKYAHNYYIIIKKGGYDKPPKKENFQTKMKKTSDNNII